MCSETTIRPVTGNLTYTWDVNKNKKSESIGGVMIGYGFTSGIGFQPVVQTSSGIGFQPVVQNRTHGPTHELLTAGGQTVNTDVKGNITLLPAVLASGL